MFCSNCGKELREEDNFCPMCGKPVRNIGETQPIVTLSQEEAEEELSSGRLLFINPETQTKSYVNFTEEKVKEINSECKDDDYYINLINNWEMNAQLKEVCKKIISITTTVGGYVVQIGKWLFNMLKEIAKQIMEKFPTMVIGATIGFILGLLFSSIPILGWLLGRVVTPLLIIGGAGLGLLSDTNNFLIAKKVTAQILKTQGFEA